MLVEASGADMTENTTPGARGLLGHRRAQRGMFAGPAEIIPRDLYAEVLRGGAERERDRLVLRPDSAVSMNTYFGRFPASYWQRWTSVSEVTVRASVTGSGSVSVLASDANSESRTIAAERVTDARDRELAFTLPLNRFVDGGGLWLDFESTTTAELSVRDVHWTVPATERDRPTSVVICTFNRVDDCLNTLAAIGGDPEALGVLEAVYVVDQGSDPVESRPRFAEVSAGLGDKLRYIRQPNLGGAGGFTRGLYEVAGGPHAEHANVLFMDDDVLVEPDMMIRTTTFANSTVEPVIVGAQMLYLLHPNQLHVGAESADLPALAPAQIAKHALAAADLTGEDESGVPNHQDIRVDAGYNGWWSCLIPSEIVAKAGYPLPMFFQWDDIEYGYRARANGFATVTLPGAGVWHADFSWKDWDDWHRYFNLRNAMITAALHSDFPAKRVCRVLTAQLVRYLVSMQYGLAATLIKAVEDFLKGPEILADGGVHAAKEIWRVRADYPETVRHPVSAVPGLRGCDYPLTPANPEPSFKRAILLKRLINLLTRRYRYEIGAVALDDATWWHISLFRTAVVTDASQEGVRIRRQDRRRMLALAKDGLRVISRLYRQTDMMKARYRSALPTLTARDNWRRLYDL